MVTLLRKSIRQGMTKANFLGRNAWMVVGGGAVK